ncbi:MAG: hypothetical protein K6U14_05250 [Firmicutes bacterium]|nr:hypothetical protein [Alicyclobacillaceae bacterium]MCL6497025.1 hypothetical protein [Bacillota bacterium]
MIQLIQRWEAVRQRALRRVNPYTLAALAGTVGLLLAVTPGSAFSRLTGAAAAAGAAIIWFGLPERR